MISVPRGDDSRKGRDRLPGELERTDRQPGVRSCPSPVEYGPIYSAAAAALAKDCS